MNVTADEAHKVHVNEVQDWLRAFKSDRHTARLLVPDFLYRLLHSLAYLTHGDALTEKGETECAA